MLRNIPHCLDLFSATILANSFVTSKLDYCNSLVYGLSKSSNNSPQNKFVSTIVDSNDIQPCDWQWPPCKCDETESRPKLATLTLLASWSDETTFLLQPMQHCWSGYSGIPFCCKRQVLWWTKRYRDSMAMTSDARNDVFSKLLVLMHRSTSGEFWMRLCCQNTS